MSFNEEIFFTGGLNTDDDLRAVPKGDYTDMQYSRLGDVTGQGGTVVTSLGTIEVPNAALTSDDRVLGGFPWQKANAIVYLVYKEGADDQIWAYYIDTQSHVLVCESSEFLFDKDLPILHGNIIGDLFKFVQPRWNNLMYADGGARLFTPPYQINLQKAIDGEYAIYDLQTIDAVKWPLAPPTCVYDTDQTRFDNKLRRKLFRFMVQPIYENGEEGNWSMYSNLALPTQSEFVSGTNWPDSSQDNVIRVTFETGSDVVKKINVAVQQYDEKSGGVETPFGIFLQLNKTTDFIPDNSTFTIDFYGNVSTKPINAIKNYDRLPIWAACQEYLPTSELTYVNFREGYDKVELNAQASYERTEINWRPTVPYLRVVSANTAALLSFSWNIDTAFTIEAGDVFTCNPYFSNGQVITLSYTVTQADINAALALPTVSDQLDYILNVILTAYAAQAGTQTGDTFAVVGDSQLDITSGVLEWGDNDQDTQRLVQTLVQPSLKQGATHEFGIVYGDRAYRDGTVNTYDELKVFVPLAGQDDLSSFTNPNNPYYVTPKITISHLPPIWATKYWIVARPTTEILDFSQYVINQGPTTAVSAIGTETNTRYFIDLDNYYTTENQGATINHQIQVGDIVRFIRKRLLNEADPDPSEYVSDYFELEVLDYESAGGIDGRQRIYVESFNLGLIDPDTWKGQLVEIYTPRPSLNTDGTLFVSEWRDVTPAINISNAHTKDRSHDVIRFNGVADLFFDGTQNVYLHGNWSFYVGATVSVSDNSFSPPFVQSGTIISADYIAGENPLTNIGTTLIQIDGGWTQVGYVSSNQALFELIYGTDQEVVDGSNVTSAILNFNYGDVYVRQRDYQTGYDALNVTNYWFIEDPHYSDYWLSDIHEVGRFRVEDPNAKMTHRNATAIHSDPFILNTEINGLSSFSLNNDNIQDMNPLHGDVTRVFTSGRDGKTLKCLQPRKENSIYIGFYPDVTDTPQGNLRVDRNRTFSSWYDLKGNYGCKDGGGAAILPNGSVIYFDPISRNFIYSGGQEQITISGIDPVTRNNFKFRNGTNEISDRFLEGSYIRTYVNEAMGEVGFGFYFNTVPLVSFDLEAAVSGSSTITVFGDATLLEGTTITVTLIDELTGQITVIKPKASSVSYNAGTNISTITMNANSPLSTKLGSVGNSPEYVSNIWVFDYIKMRWRATYNYGFQCFANFGGVLLGFGTDCKPYLHNQDSLRFHGTNITQVVEFASNENPLAVKRYQELVQRSNKTWSFYCEADSNLSYSQMGTEMPDYLFSVFEGYSRSDFRKNRYSVGYASEAMAMACGEDVRANALRCQLIYPAYEKNSTSILFSVGINGVLS